MGLKTVYECDAKKCNESVTYEERFLPRGFVPTTWTTVVPDDGVPRYICPKHLPSELKARGAEKDSEEAETAEVEAEK